LLSDVATAPLDDRAAALLVLRILVVDLDCYEAGESLARARLVEPLRNGRYATTVCRQTVIPPRPSGSSATMRAAPRSGKGMMKAR